MRIRPGGPGDIAAVLALGDEAVKWMNARGNTRQWGTTPWTGNQKREAAIGDQARGGGMRIAEDQDGVVLGALVITEIPAAYVPAATERELYINLLLVSRRYSGQGIGAALIEHAKQEAAARGIGLIRVDCWAGQDGSLVRVYEKYGFSRVQDFTVALPAGEWPECCSRCDRHNSDPAHGAIASGATRQAKRAEPRAAASRRP